MEGFKSQAQWERCEKLVAEGKMTQDQLDKYVAATGVDKSKLPIRLGKKS